MATNLEDARKLLSEVQSELLTKPNVIATGLGYKISAGKQTKNLSLICSVITKRPKVSLASSELIPPSIQDIPTDVFPSGVIHALQDPTGKFRPAPGGVSIGHYQISAGTLGCYVKKNNKQYVLSNNHVLANSNDASIGDPILQPGPYDGGNNPQDKFATLSEFVPINFLGEENDVTTCPIGNFAATLLNKLAALVGSETRLESVRPQSKAQAGDNLVDCAIAELVDPGDSKDEILQIGKVDSTAEAALGMAIHKYGRTTKYTTGTIQQIDVTSQVSYGTNKTAYFVDQLMAGAMSDGGDSGSAVLSMDNKLVGLLYAGSDTTTVINRIQNVFNALKVTL